MLPSIGNEVLKAVVAQYNAEQLLTQRDKVTRAGVGGMGTYWVGGMGWLGCKSSGGVWGLASRAGVCGVAWVNAEKRVVCSMALQLHEIDVQMVTYLCLRGIAQAAAHTHPWHPHLCLKCSSRRVGGWWLLRTAPQATRPFVEAPCRLTTPSGLRGGAQRADQARPGVQHPHRRCGHHPPVLRHGGAYAKLHATAGVGDAGGLSLSARRGVARRQKQGFFGERLEALGVVVGGSCCLARPASPTNGHRLTGSPPSPCPWDNGALLQFTKAVEAKQVAQQEAERARFVVMKADQVCGPASCTRATVGSWLAVCSGKEGGWLGLLHGPAGQAAAARPAWLHLGRCPAQAAAALAGVSEACRTG